MKKIVIATRNNGKIREMMDAFHNLEVELLPLSVFENIEEAKEDGETFAANAYKKAKFYMEQTKCACLADDSGLEVERLNGAPGVYSARFAGYHANDTANNEKLLNELRLIRATESNAAYICALSFVDTDGKNFFTCGRCEGIVKMTAKGTGGFGYDPYFYVEENKTMAELTLKEKDVISHRGKALREMAQILEEYLKSKKNEMDKILKNNI